MSNRMDRRESTLSLCLKWVCDAVTGNKDEYDDLDSTSGGEKETPREENERLGTEIDLYERDNKKLKAVIEQLTKDYEESKDYDPLRRYERLKNMVKRTILSVHVMFNPDDPNSVGYTPGAGMVQGNKDLIHQAQSARRRETKYSWMSDSDLQDENLILLDQLREQRRKNAIIKTLVENLQKHYSSSKRLAIIQRYSLLKEMVKTVIHDELSQ